MLLLLFMFYQYINFVLPGLIIAVYKFLLVILEISPRFVQDITIALPLYAVNLVCSDIDMDILSKLNDNVGKLLCRELNTNYMDNK